MQLATWAPPPGLPSDAAPAAPLDTTAAAVCARGGADLAAAAAAAMDCRHLHEQGSANARGPPPATAPHPAPADASQALSRVSTPDAAAAAPPASAHPRAAHVAPPPTCRLCNEAKPVHQAGMFKHYCGTCAVIRQRGYKRNLTLRDLRSVVQTHGMRPTVPEFIELALEAKAANPNGGASEDDVRLSDAEGSPPRGSRVVRSPRPYSPEPAADKARVKRARREPEAGLAVTGGVFTLTKMNTGEKIAAETLAALSSQVRGARCCRRVLCSRGLPGGPET